MCNEYYDKIRYSNLLNFIIIEILLFLLKPGEIFKSSFITIIICLYLFITIFMVLSYDAYNHIIIQSAKNQENLYYYFFLKNKNKNISFYLTNKIKEHVSICNSCSLCEQYQTLCDNNNVIELINDNEDNQENELSENVFHILYNGKDKLIILFN